MSLIAVIADPLLSMPWADELRSDGHVVQCHWGSDAAENLFAGECPEIVVIDIENPEWAETMLIPQCQAKWPDSKVIAVVSGYDFRNSAVYEMGLWEPDQLLLKPLAPRLLAATVTFLWAQMRSAEIKQLVRDLPFVLPGEAELEALEAPATQWDPDEEAEKRRA